MQGRLLTATVALAFSFGVTFASEAQATLALTSDGTTDGFTLDTFASGWGNNGFLVYGPLSQGVASNGNVIAPSSLDQKIYVFNDVNGQTFGSAISATPYACQTGNCNFAMTTVNGQVYGAQAFGGTYEKFNSDGTFAPMTGAVASLRSNLGMWTDPTNGHIISASTTGLVDINPADGSFRVINAGLFPDGVSVSSDGTKVFVANGGTVQVYDKTTGALLNTFSVGHSPDGMGVISGGLFNGFIVVNNNDGTVGLIDPTVGTEDIIASGGSRGDFVSADPTTGTLFLSQNELIDRLGCGPGCTIGNAVPEPSTWAMLLLGFAGIGFMYRRKAKPLLMAA